MIEVYIQINDQKDHLELDENMNIKETLYVIYQKEYNYGYLSKHCYYEKLTCSFKEANIYYGETIVVEGSISN